MTQKKPCIALHMPSTLPFIIWYFIGFSYLWLVVARRLQKCHHLKEKENKKKSANYFAKTMCHSAHPKSQNFLKNKIYVYLINIGVKCKQKLSQIEYLVQVTNKRQLTKNGILLPKRF